MALILNIETSTKVCSVALGLDGELKDIEEFHDESYSHAEKLNLMILDLLDRNQIKFEALDAIAISEGPGSYTGLRIGTSTAKGICYAADKPLIGINTLDALCNQVSISKGLKIPMIDARRMEVFSATYNESNKLIEEQSNNIITPDYFDAYKDQDLVIFGNGSNKLAELIAQYPNISLVNDIACSAKGMISLADEKFNLESFADTAYFEPNYGKEFYTTAKVKA